MNISTKIGLSILIILVSFFLVGILQMVFFPGRILVTLAILGGAIKLAQSIWSKDQNLENKGSNSSYNKPAKYSGGHNAQSSVNNSSSSYNSSISQQHDQGSSAHSQKSDQSSSSYKKGSLYN